MSTGQISFRPKRERQVYSTVSEAFEGDIDEMSINLGCNIILVAFYDLFTFTYGQKCTATPFSLN